MLPRGPFTLLDGDDVLFFKDMSSLTRYVEPIDVAEGSFKVFDADGRPLLLATNRRVVTFLGIPAGDTFMPITVETQVPDADSTGLRRVLIAYLKNIGEDPEGLEALPLASLLNRATTVAGFSV